MKHRCVALFIIFSIARPAFSQGYDSSYRFYYWDQKLSMFETMPQRPKEVVWLGDSITDGGEWSELFPGINTLNRGISADNTFGILARLYEVTRRKPAKIFLLIGINDIARNIPVSTICQNYLKIVQQIKQESPATALYLQTLLPTNNEFKDFPKHQNKTEQVLTINDFIKSLARSHQVQVIDLHAAFADANGQLNKKYTNDGLHLMGAGYQHWKTIIEQSKALQ
jgi:lysophospholipase L1-like esterase